ncbi:helix-turn-helix domain-containing protein [Novosphingopyxis sp.]|uniref:helix-turn-helix domain-containing protein n=1 Tax=Novosphingopyxis sp. TaxID=2709690 RepID=UPI003B5C0366
MIQAATPSILSPQSWGETLSGAPVFDRTIEAGVPGLVRRWQAIDPEIDQAALDHHFISIHLGGPKRLFRKGEGQSLSCDIGSGAYSVVPAGASFRWVTHGPIDFAHIYIKPTSLDRVIGETFDRDPARISLCETLGKTDPLVISLSLTLIDEFDHADSDCVYLGEIMHLLLSRIVGLHSDVGTAIGRARHALAPFRLRRAIDFIEGNLAAAIGVAEIAAASGVSPYHFSRAFRQSTGRPPYAYLVERRIAAAKPLLATSGLAISDIALRCGFTSLSQFSRVFRQHTGSTPSRYRDRY